MNDPYVEIIRAASKPLEPLPTKLTPSLPEIPGIRAVMFDIYGTLLVSASGDIGAADPTLRGEAFHEAISAIGGYYRGDTTTAAAQLRTIIEMHHEKARTEGCPFPEVDIVEVWQETCRLLGEHDQLELPPRVDWARLAIEFEVRVNPVWPMPGLDECLAELHRAGRVVGIISNAQFFTPLALRAVGGKSLEEHGFSPALRYYSYEHLCAKPGRALYDLAVAGLAAEGIEPAEVLYVGNDMRNDIWPAASVGFRTVLFAGDQRSLRLREDDPLFNTRDQPESTVTELLQIPALI